MPRLILSKNQPLWIYWQSAMYRCFSQGGVGAGLVPAHWATTRDCPYDHRRSCRYGYASWNILLIRIYFEQLPRLIHKTAWWCAELDLFEIVNSGAPLKLLESWVGNHLVNVHTGLPNDNSGWVRQSYPRHNQRPRHEYFFTAKVIVLLITKIKKMSVVFTTIPLSRKNKYPYKSTI